MDDHLEKLNAVRGRILETVWYVGCPGSARELRDHVKTILGDEDLLIVAKAESAAWTKLLVSDESLIQSWQNNA